MMQAFHVTMEMLKELRESCIFLFYNFNSYLIAVPSRFFHEHLRSTGGPPLVRYALHSNIVSNSKGTFYEYSLLAICFENVLL